MATAIKKCKVCGSEYEYCHTLRNIAGVFRWQDVACCPEHGSVYLARIRESRMQEPTIAPKSEVEEDIFTCLLSMEDFIDCELEDNLLCDEDEED